MVATLRFVGIIGIFFIVLTSFFTLKNNQTLSQKKVLAAKTETVPTKKEFELPGTIDAHEKVTLRFATSGKLAYVGVKEGDVVKKGQLIAYLDSRALKKQLSQDLNTFKSKRWDLDQERDDAQDGGLTEQLKRLVDKAQFSVDNAVIDVELQTLALEYSRIVSPIDGIVTGVSSPISGVHITPSQAEFEIFNPQTLYFHALASQEEVKTIKEGAVMNISLGGFDETIKGTVIGIGYSPIEGQKETKYGVDIQFDSFDYYDSFRLGMTGIARLE